MTNVTTNKITIAGTPPQFNEAELKRRQEGFHHMYKNTLQCMELVGAVIPFDFLNKVIAKSKQGYSLVEKHIITTLPLDYSVYMLKPEEHREADLLEIDAKVKAEYVDFLKDEHLRYQELLRHQLIQAAEARDLKKAEDAQAKRLASIEAEVAATYKKLVIPD